MEISQSTSKPVPSTFRRLMAVCYRHMTTYNRNFFTNSFGVVLEPLIFFMAVGWGLASAIGSIDGVPYLVFLVPGQIMTSVVYSVAFETSYGTYFRLEMDHNYDSMMVTPLGVSDIFWGELLYVGVRAAFFSTIPLVIFGVWGLILSPWAVLVPLVCFFTAIAIGSLGLFANRLVKSLNQFNFFVSGLIAPLLFFSGTLFPIDKIPKAVAFVMAWMPLYPSINLCRMLTTGHFQPELWVTLVYVVLVPWPLGYLGVKCIRPKLIK